MGRQGGSLQPCCCGGGGRGGGGESAPSAGGGVSTGTPLSRRLPRLVGREVLVGGSGSGSSSGSGGGGMLSAFSRYAAIALDTKSYRLMTV